MATTTITTVIPRPPQGAPTNSTLTLFIASVSVGNITIPPVPATTVFLPDGTPFGPNANPAVARDIGGVYYFFPAADTFVYRYQNPATVPTVALPSTAPTLSATGSQPQSTAGDIHSQDTNISTGKAAPTASSPLYPEKSSANSGLQSGAAAGLAIGCLLAGVVLAGAFFWFFCGKRRRSRPQYSEANSMPLVAQEKGFRNQTTPLNGKNTVTTALISSLPQPLEDKAISGDISKISNSIKNHVQSYYHTSRVSPALIDHDDLQGLGPKMPIAIGTLSTLLANAATREIALRFCIAWAVISRMQESSTQSNGLLPAEIAGCFQQIMRTNSNSTSQVVQTTQWRTMTAELMHSTYVRNPFSSSDSRNTSIQGIMRALDNVLQPYADSRMDNEQRKRNLEEVIKRSALFAFTLFSQPSLWEFDWKEEQGVKSGELCIFPALVQTADENGEAVRPPRPFSEEVVRRLD